MPHWWICGASGIERVPDVEQRGALLERDLDRVDGGARRLLGVRGDGGDRLAAVPHLAVGEQRLVGRHAETLEMAVDVLGDVERG